MPNQGGYPTEEELLKIERWNFSFHSVDERNKALQDFLDFLESLWHWPDWGFKKRKGRDELFKKPCIKLDLNTGGWSGNENVVCALEKNLWFWSLYWVSSRRGGHFSFEIKLN